MPLALQAQIKPATKATKAKNQTVFLIGAVANLLRQIHDGVATSALLLDQSSLRHPSSMVSIRIASPMLDVLDSTATRFYQPTTRLVLWAVALAMQRQEFATIEGADRQIKMPTNMSVPEEIGTLMDNTAAYLGIEPAQYPQYATDLLVQAIRVDKPLYQLGLPKGAWPKTTRNVPVFNPQYRKLLLEPETADEVLALAPQLYHSPSNFVLWACCWVGFRIAKMS